MRFASLLLSFLLILCSIAAAEETIESKLPVTVKALVDRTAVSIGDRIRYTIEVEAGKEIEVRIPEFGENLADFSVRDFGSSKGGFWGKQKLAQWYVLDIYEAGTYTIPAVTVSYRTGEGAEWMEVVSDEIIVEVKSLLNGEAETEEIRDIKGPLSAYNVRLLYIALAVLLAVVIIVAIVMFLKNRKRTKEIIVPPRPAHEIAFEAFEELVKKDLLMNGRVNEYYFELSNIIRHYLENRFKLRAPEMTTEEFLSSLRQTDKLEADHKTLLREFMSHCDMVKFAKYLPAENEIESSYESARKLVEQTKEMAA
ncbi:MAG: BatD family protein [Nitrospirota bacterium]